MKYVLSICASVLLSALAVYVLYQSAVDGEPDFPLYVSIPFLLLVLYAVYAEFYPDGWRLGSGFHLPAPWTYRIGLSIMGALGAAGVFGGALMTYSSTTYQSPTQEDVIEITGQITHAETTSGSLPYLRLQLASTAPTLLIPTHLLPERLQQAPHEILEAGSTVTVSVFEEDLQDGESVASVYAIATDEQVLMSLSDYAEAQTANQRWGLGVGVVLLIAGLLLLALPAFLAAVSAYSALRPY